MWPVTGSVAAYYVATLMSLTASSTSLLLTVSDSLILAKASESLIKDSSYLGVAVMTFLDEPIYLI